MSPEGLPIRRSARLTFWTRWLSPDSPFKANRDERMEKDRPLAAWAVRALPESAESVRILDVNAGPATALGAVAEGLNVELIPIDDLAHLFTPQLEKESLVPPVPTRFCAPEDVRVTFGESAFHLIYSFNGLDFSSDPVAVYRELLKALIQGGKIITFNESTPDTKRISKESYRFFHQIENGRLLILHKGHRWDLQDALPEADIAVSEENGFIRVEIGHAAIYGGSITLPDRLSAGEALPPMISMHLPKTAGSSFRNFLQSLYGDSLRCMYTFKETAPKEIKYLKLNPGTRCLHGHFQAQGFDHLLPGALKVTWMRDPVERVVSSYFQFLRHPHMRDESDFNQLLFDSGWSLMEFARHESVRNQIRWYFNAVPLEAFYFVGITEFYEAGMQLFCHLLGLDPAQTVDADNINPEKKVLEKYRLSPAQRDELNALYAEEIELYKLAQYRFQKQLRLAFGDQAPELAIR